MPNIAYGNTEREDVIKLRSIDYGYDYPDGLDLKPGSKLHDELRDMILERASVAASSISNRFESWNRMDMFLTAYKPIDEDEADVLNMDSRKPVSIVFPYSYAILETLLAYMISAFFREPIFRYEGVGHDDVVGSILMEKIVNLHCNKFKVMLNLHTMFRDAFSYGIGIVAPVWKSNYKGTFEGNALINIDPYRYLPDPNVAADKIQDGEFVGWVNDTNFFDLLKEEDHDDSLFNVKYIKHLGDTVTSIYGPDHSMRNERTGSNLTSSNGLKPVQEIPFYVKLIPSEWGLGSSEVPEKWFFRLAGDAVIIAARKADFDHGKFPIAVTSPDFDGYSSTPLSRLEILSGLQGVLDWLFNCYDKDTEVLTPTGWQYIKDAKLDNSPVATIDPDSNELWFETPEEWYEYDYDGDLVSFKSKRHDILVTPNHMMFGNYRNKEDSEFVSAIDLFKSGKCSEFKIPTSCVWDADPIDEIIFDAIYPIRDRGRDLRYPEIIVDGYDMANFLGWLLSDGSINKGSKSGSYSVSIKQVKTKNINDIDTIINALGFHVTRYHYPKQDSYQWTITDKRLFNWLKNTCYIGGTTGIYKRVPDFILNGDVKCIELFLNSYIQGDGHIVKDHSNLVRIGTESIHLANDIQHLCMKINWSCHIRKSHTALGKDFWYLNINKNSPKSTVTKDQMSFVPYKDKVYCFTNSTHLTLVRRNGKSYICGQSHIANVRKAIHDMIIYDPFLVNTNDLRDPAPGKLIRIRKPGWGKGVKDAVQQLAVNDITRSNVADSNWIVQWMQKIGATDDVAMGAMRSGGPERVTKAEFQGTASGAVSRLERIAKMIGLQAMQDIGEFFADHTIQVMDRPAYIKVAGDWQDLLHEEYADSISRGRMKVYPDQLNVMYDVIVRDGSIPGGNSSEVWLRMFDILSQQPELAKHFDIVKIFKHIARTSGAKNVNEFVRRGGDIQSNVTPNDQVAQQLQAGNIRAI